MGFLKTGALLSGVYTRALTFEKLSHEPTVQGALAKWNQDGK